MDKKYLIDDNFKKPEIFKELTNEQFNEFMGTGFLKTLNPKQVLFHQGDSADMCFFIKQGRLKLTQVNEDGKEVILRYVGFEELVAAIALMKESKYPVTAEPIEKSEVIGWDKPAFISLLEKFPRIAIKILTIVIGRLEDIQNRYMELCTEQAEQRIARTLLRFLQRTGTKTVEGICIDMPLTRQDLAEYMGTTLYTVSRTLSAWEKRGWITSERGRLTVIQPHAIVLLAEKTDE